MGSTGSYHKNGGTEAKDDEKDLKYSEKVADAGDADAMNMDAMQTVVFRNDSKQEERDEDVNEEALEILKKYIKRVYFID